MEPKITTAKVLLCIGGVILLCMAPEILNRLFESPIPQRKLIHWTFNTEQNIKHISIKYYASNEWSDSLKHEFSNAVLVSLKKEFPNGYPVMIETEENYDNPLYFSWRSYCGFKKSYIREEEEVFNKVCYDVK